MTLNEFVNRPDEIIIQEKNGKIILFSPKLQIFIEGDSLDRLYDNFKEEKKIFFYRLEAIDALHLIPKLSEKNKFLKSLDFQKIFVERMISFFLTLIFFVCLTLVITHQIAKGISKMSETFIPSTPEKKERRIQDFKEKLNATAPYLHEIKKVYNEP